MIGQTISHYEILAKLGEGGMGVVYRARDTRLRRDVAIKVLPPDAADDAERLHRFKIEARALARQNHPNIVTIHDVDDHQGVSFLVMELVEGEPLSRLIPGRGFSLERFFQHAIPLAEAVGAAHEQGVVHRDLKPGNVMVTPEGVLKVLDFGLAELRPAETETDSTTETAFLPGQGHGPGTLPYMSPEQLRGEGADHRSDIFSLGIILYEVATGRHPFLGRSGAESTTAILRDQPPDASEVRTDLPRHLGRIVRQCLEKRPERRLQNARDLAVGLKDLKRELTLSTETTSVPQPVRRPVRSWAIGATLLLVVAAAGWLAWQRTPSHSMRGPPHLAVAGFRGFSGGPGGAEYFRDGTIDAMRDRLRSLRGVYIIPEGGHPETDYRLEIDVRRVRQMVSLSYRLLVPDNGADPLTGDVLEAPLDQLYPTLDRIAHVVADHLRSRSGIRAQYKPAAIPTASSRALDLYLEGRSHLETANDPARALELLTAACAEDPEFAPAFAALGEARRRLFIDVRSDPQLGEARNACTEAVALDGALAEAEICLGRVAATAGRSVETATHFRRAIELDPNAAEAYEGLLGAHLALLGNPAVAVRVWREIIDRHPDHWAGYYYLGKYWSAQAHYDEAIELYRQALALTPRNAKILTSLGGVLIWKGDYEAAIVSLRKAIAIRPGVGAYSNLGTVLFFVRRFAEAIEALERAVRMPETEHFFVGNLARAYYWGGRVEEARSAFEQAAAMAGRRLESEPASLDAFIMLPLYHAMLGHRELALELLGKPLETHPEDPHVLFTAGQVHNQLGDTARALDFLERAVAAGYSTAEIRQSIEFDNLRSEASFEALLSHEEKPGGNER